jgi:hypothetical protein
MVIVVSVLLLAAIVTVIAAGIHVVLRVIRWAASSPPGPASGPERTGSPPPYGALPTLADPVGGLGGLSPDADLSSGATSSRDLYGE